MPWNAFVEMLSEWWMLGRDWTIQNVFVTDTLVAAGIIVAAYLIALALVRPGRDIVTRLIERLPETRRRMPQRATRRLMLPTLMLICIFAGRVVADAAQFSSSVLIVAENLVAAWVAIRAASLLIRDPTFARGFAMVVWTIAALNILGLLNPVVAALDGFAVSFGELRLSAYSLIKGLVALVVLLWVAAALTRFVERRVQAAPNLTPSVQVLATTLSRILLISLAIVGALSTVGVDLTAFAVFGGAVGVGLGFGLQKIVSNLVSGVILLLDHSVKPGDVIVVGETYGWINSLNARYVSVITRDGIEFLIPNEELITGRVENWSYSNNLVRLRSPVGISYGADVRKAMALCIEAAGEVERVLKEPKPICLLTGFGDSSVDLEMRYWINDPPNGIGNVKSAVLLGVWDRFHEHGIEIPFPQRDLHLKSSDVALYDGRAGAAARDA